MVDLIGLIKCGFLIRYHDGIYNSNILLERIEYIEKGLRRLKSTNYPDVQTADMNEQLIQIDKEEIEAL